MTVSDLGLANLGLDGPRLLADSIAGKFPDALGRFGPFGGRYVPETLIPAMERLEQGVREHLHSAPFQEALGRGLSGRVGRRDVPETLIPAMERLEQGVREHLHSAPFQEALGRELSSWIGRPTAL